MKKYKVQRRKKGWKTKRLVKNKIGYMKYRHVTTSDCYGKDESCILWFDSRESAVNYLKERYKAKDDEIKFEEE